MNDQVAFRFRRAGLSRVRVRLAMISLILLIAAVVVGPLIALAASSLSFPMALLGFTACLASALLGHLLSEFPRGHEFMMTRVMSSMVVRAGIPLAAVLFCKFILPSEFSQGFVYYIVLLYLVGLISEAIFSLGRLQAGLIEPTSPPTPVSDHKSVP